MKLTPMQEFAMDLFRRNKGEWLSPHHLSAEWGKAKGHRKYGDSRARFGQTSNAWKTMYRLRDLGLVEVRKINTYIPDYEFRLK